MKRLCALLCSLIILLSVCGKEISAQHNTNYANPILSGFYPDPSICKVNDEYFLVTSTFSYYPGLPVFKSKDLVNWKLTGYVLNTPEQLDLEGQGVSRGLFAPAIRFHDGLFYVTCTLVDIGGNFVVTSKSAEGPWSDPVWLPEVNGIDPSLFFDDDGKAYIIYNSDAPGYKPLYDGHRTLRMYEFNYKNLKVVGEEKLIINGGTDLSKNPIWIEAPHIFKVDGHYYLIAAEGGTADWHSEVVFRSKNVFGPYIPFKDNPILTQRHLDKKRVNPITSTGHADFVQTENGDWWAVFLGCRPYSLEHDGMYNTGRETFLAPVKWITDEEGIKWPIINYGNELVQYHYPQPLKSGDDISIRPYGGNFTIRDEFENAELDLNWMFLRTPKEKWYSINSEQGILTLDLKPETCGGKSNPAFIGQRQHHLKCSASTSFEFKPGSENEKAGLLIFQNEENYYLICKSVENGEQVIQLLKSGNEESYKVINSVRITEGHSHNKISVKIFADKEKYTFSYSINDEWKLLAENVDGNFLSTGTAGGFVGCMFALYVTSNNQQTSNKVHFDFYEYSGDDEVYK
ncbi:MAG: glycoside hydrolase family 43 protein [Ignavibacteriales bacterium]|nr:MAG: glycoside hydrolase family 43 protein [Ignavibacteriales bacterium]